MDLPPAAAGAAAIGIAMQLKQLKGRKARDLLEAAARA